MDNQPNNTNSSSPTNWPRLVVILLVIGGLVGLFVVASNQFVAKDGEVSMTSLADMIQSGKITSITVNGDDLMISSSDGKTLHARKDSSSGIYETLSVLGVSQDALHKVDIKISGPGAWSFLGNFLFTVVPLVIIGWFAFRIMNSMRSGQDQALGFGRSRARTFNIDRPVVTFDDVAGVEESKQEVREIVDFLKDPERFIRLGARVPKGVLMIGPPGTGKTLLARAIAGEAGVPFMSISGSEFVEMFVGVGASRVRDLFDKAKQVAPCIVFVDEIDAVGRMRGTGLGGGHDEREQTLNQILVEMDGFDNDTNIIVIAATNRADVLDPALLRPGRFDRKVYIDRPDVGGREQIMKVHAKGKPLMSDVDLTTMAKLTPGFSGADIENLFNEAAILAARRNKSGINMAELQEAMEKMIAGPERRSRVVSAEEREIVAYHEAGHAVVMHFLEFSDPVHKITIIPRGQTGGSTMFLPESMDSMLLSRDQLEDRIVGLLGGRAAEDVTFNRVTTGASNDLERATQIARAMVTRYGMSERLGLRVFGEDPGTPFLGRSLGEQRDYSEESARSIDEEVSTILTAAYDRARGILSQHSDKLWALAKMLLDIETVDRQQFEMLMSAA